jgi:hypothetical protein
MEPGRPAITLARPGAPIVRTELTDRELSRLAPGQRASVQVESLANQRFEASVLELDTAPGAMPVARLRVDWSSQSAPFGASAQTIVTLQQKENVLLVPQRAIRTLGQRRFVEVTDGTSRRNVDVQPGIVQDGDVEIVSGLTAGQLVVVGP